MDTIKMIEQVRSKGGTELHLKIGSKPLMRKSKFLKKIDSPVVQTDDINVLISELLSDDEKKKFLKSGKSFEKNYFGKPPCNYRLNLFYSRQKPAAVIKIIDNKIPTLEEIQFPRSVVPLMSARKGLFIISGPARSGISTSLAALIEQINKSQSKHILVIEDPIEFLFEEKLCRISQQQFKKDIFSIEQGINFAKRMDVDSLVIGDLKRDIPFKNILEYVSGGHFVILSMQTWGIVNTLERIIYSYPEHDKDLICNTLADNLLGVCSQALLTDPTGSVVAPAHEILVKNTTVESIIRKGKIVQIEHNITSAGEGSQLFAQHISTLSMRGLDRDIGAKFLEIYKTMKG